MNNIKNIIEDIDKIYKYAEIMSKSNIIPKHYQCNPSNVFVAVQTAYKMDVDPMHVMENTFFLNGKLGINSAFIISLANKSGIFKNGITYEPKGEGQTLEVTAKAVLKDGSEISYTASYKMAQADGWTRNPKYKSMPEHMLKYRAATLLIRTHVPEVLSGFHTTEELEDVKYANSQTQNVLEEIKKKQEIKKEPANENVDLELQNEITRLVLERDVPEKIIKAWLNKAQVDYITELPIDKIKACIEYINTNYPALENKNTEEEL